MLLKSRILETVETFENEVDSDEFIERLLIIEKIEKANIQSLNGEVVSHQDLKSEVKIRLE